MSHHLLVKRMLEITDFTDYIIYENCSFSDFSGPWCIFIEMLSFLVQVVPVFLLPFFTVNCYINVFNNEIE